MVNQYTKAKMISEKNRKEILWNMINSLLAGALVLLGALTDGKITWAGLVLALVAAGIVAVSQFKDYWTKEKKEYCTPKIFKFL
jgi:hypothetical protein